MNCISIKAHANNIRKKRCGMWEGFPNSKHLDNSTRSLTNSEIFNVSIDMEPLGSCGKAKRENNASKGPDCETRNIHITEEPKEFHRYLI